MLLSTLLGLMNSQTFRALVELQMAFGSYEVGVIEKTPIPDLALTRESRVGEVALECVGIKRELDRASEVSHIFTLPAALREGTLPLSKALGRWHATLEGARSALARNEQEIDGIAQRLYGLTDDNVAAPAVITDEEGPPVEPDEEPGVDQLGPEGQRELSAQLLSWSIGCVLGRFDVRMALDRSLIPALQGPFEPLPACPPGMLVDPDGLPASRNRIVSDEWLRARPDAITPPPSGSVAPPTISDSEYPFAVDWDGILVDDPEHDDDVVRRVREVLHVIWGDGADGIEQEACEMLGVKELRDWFRNPRNFWDDHIKRYSKSRRKAPINWLLQSSKRSFALWIYYHRLDGDMLAKALTTYVEPKVRREETRLAELRAAFEAQQPTGAAARKAERDIERQEALVSELVEFRAAFDRATKLGLQPDLDDGVVLNIAPLHGLVPWKVARQYWDELLAGKYEWSTVSKQLRTKGLVR